MRLANIYWLLLILLLPYLYRLRKNAKPAALPHPDLAWRLTRQEGKARLKELIPLVFRLAALILLVVALARPQTGFRPDNANRFGVDIMVALDVSSSMTAEDFVPNRIMVAKKVLADFIRSRRDDRIGLIVFGAQSYLQSPLTTDHKTLLSFLDDVKVGMAEDGTAIGMALGNAVKRLKDSKARSKVVLLLTDGDNNAGAIDPETAAKLAATYNIKVYAIGIGDPRGAPIPITDQFGNKTYAYNPDGTPFLTKMNVEGLKKIASLTEGGYFLASDGGKLRAIFQQIDKMEKVKFEGKTQYVFDEQFAFFAFPGLFLLLAEMLLVRFWVRPLP
ncbi:MAG: VWA domain-containing protein [Candidatus Margulisbacteria bacterium]|nr:VWA domain-containing protein [Candidatus Margulisiibacteriota bacterium]MBU1616163.1 VWA domain-containing protein [Candidatus Margulisiibacteriota bacterium]MBU1867371.1 VWA domain-containing protein [Candidatus Margulisiibacteriota bacterium]